MARYRNTVVGSYPRPSEVADTMKKPTLTQAETDDMIRWAAKDQADLGLDVITDGEAYRENIYYFYQKRVDGVTFENMPRLAFRAAGFGIECPRVIGRIENPRFNLAHNWQIAREAAPSHVRVKQTVTGPHVLTRFSVNERRDLYPDDQALRSACARVLRDELIEVVAAGCTDVQFGEPMWTESPHQSEWAADAPNELIAAFPGHVRIGLHVCGGNPRRKRIYFTKYTDLAPAFRKMNIQEVSLEHCTLGYDLMELWSLWDFKGDLALGVIDQRSDEIETVDMVRRRIEPALRRFPRERLVLSSECGFGHVPLDITRKKLKALVQASYELCAQGRLPHDAHRHASASDLPLAFELSMACRSRAAQSRLLSRCLSEGSAALRRDGRSAYGGGCCRSGHRGRDGACQAARGGAR